MKQFKIKHLAGGFVCALLLLGTSAPFFFTSCENEHPEITITIESDFSGIIEAINNTNKTLVEKLAAIEAAINNGIATQSEAQDLIKQALESLNGTLEDKLDAIEDAISSQTTSLEAKLGLIEAAVDGGFADQAAAQDLIKQAIDSLSGTMEDKLDALEEAITSQTTSIEAKLALIEAAINNGFADQSDALGLIQEAVESLEGTVEEKLSAIETAVNNQTTSLETKLGLIETAINSGFTNQEQALGLIKDAVLTLKDSVDGLDDAIDDVVDAIDGVADTIGDTNDALDDIADALNDIIDSIGDIPDYSGILSAIYAALTSLDPNSEPQPGPVSGMCGPFGGLYLSPGYLVETVDGYSLSEGGQLEILQYYQVGDAFSTLPLPRYYHRYQWGWNTDPLVIDGFTIPTLEQYETILGTSTVPREGATVNDVPGKHYAMVAVDLTGSEYESYGFSGNNTINGLLLLPDRASFSCPELTSLDDPQSLNSLSYNRLIDLCSGSNGCAFLPFAGRFYQDIGWSANFGCYWTSSGSPDHLSWKYSLYFDVGSIESNNYGAAPMFYPVRMVSDGNIPDPNNIVFADPNVKARIVENYDTNCDGEISYAEAAAVSAFPEGYFKGGQYTSFDEFQYFTGITYIPRECFMGCSSLQSLTLPSSITGVGPYALNGCRSIKEFVFSENVKSFGEGALGNFAADRLVFLAEDHISMNEHSFTGSRECYTKELVYYIKEPPFFGQHTQFGSGGVGFAFRGERILVPADALYRYQEVWYQQKEYLDVIPETDEETITFVDSTVKNMLADAFDTNSDGELSYGEAAAVTSDQMAHFFENSGITSFDEFKFFRGLTSVPEACFKGCTNLTSIIIPTYVQSLEASAFEGCSSLEDLFFKESLNNVASRALAGCTGLKSLKFYSCPALDHPFGNPAENLPLLESMYIYSFGLPEIDENTLNIPTSCVLFVSNPSNLQTFDVWSGYASQMQKIPDWETYWRLH